jgi:hypothetical protein
MRVEAVFGQGKVPAQQLKIGMGHQQMQKTTALAPTAIAGNDFSRSGFVTPKAHALAMATTG